MSRKFSATLMLFLCLIGVFACSHRIHVPNVPRTPIEQPKTITRTEIQRVVVLDLSRMFQACMWVGIIGLSASIALMTFLPFLATPARAGAAMFGALFGLSFMSKLLLPWAMWLGAFAALVLVLGVGYLIYRLVHSEKVIQGTAPHVDPEKLEGTAKRVIAAIRRKSQK